MAAPAIQDTSAFDSVSISAFYAVPKVYLAAWPNPPKRHTKAPYYGTEYIPKLNEYD